MRTPSVMIMKIPTHPVIPAQAGIHACRLWTPAFAGETMRGLPSFSWLMGDLNRAIRHSRAEPAPVETGAGIQLERTG